jgi:hypothetical protein
VSGGGNGTPGTSTDYVVLVQLLKRTPRVRSGIVHGHVVQSELLKLEKNGQFPDELVRIKGSQIHHVTSQTI